MEESVRWSITVSKDTDSALRSYLTRQGMKKADLSKFVEEAVRWRVLDMTVQTIRERNKDVLEDEIQTVIDEAVATVRAERGTARKS
jgi:hypothetical protein